MLDSLIHFGPTASVICGVILKVASIYWVSASVRWNKIRGVNEAQKKNPPQHKTLSFIVIIFRIAEFDISNTYSLKRTHSLLNKLDMFWMLIVSMRSTPKRREWAKHFIVQWLDYYKIAQ